MKQNRRGNQTKRNKKIDATEQKSNGRRIMTTDEEQSQHNREEGKIKQYNKKGKSIEEGRINNKEEEKDAIE